MTAALSWLLGPFTVPWCLKWSPPPKKELNLKKGTARNIYQCLNVFLKCSVANIKSTNAFEIDALSKIKPSLYFSLFCLYVLWSPHFGFLLTLPCCPAAFAPIAIYLSLSIHISMLAEYILLWKHWRQQAATVEICDVHEISNHQESNMKSHPRHLFSNWVLYKEYSIFNITARNTSHSICFPAVFLEMLFHTTYAWKMFHFQSWFSLNPSYSLNTFLGFAFFLQGLLLTQHCSNVCK